MGMIYTAALLIKMNGGRLLETVGVDTAQQFALERHVVEALHDLVPVGLHHQIAIRSGRHFRVGRGGAILGGLLVVSVLRTHAGQLKLVLFGRRTRGTTKR